MSRLVDPRPSVRLTGGPSSADAYAQRVAKYIPGEIIAAYLSVNGILMSVKPEDEARLPVAWGFFILCVVLTPIYFWVLSKANQPKRLHLFMSTIAFVIWAYAMGGVFDIAGYHKPWIGSVLLIAFTLISGLIAPREGDK